MVGQAAEHVAEGVPIGGDKGRRLMEADEAGLRAVDWHGGRVAGGSPSPGNGRRRLWCRRIARKSSRHAQASCFWISNRHVANLERKHDLSQSEPDQGKLQLACHRAALPGLWIDEIEGLPNTANGPDSSHAVFSLPGVRCEDHHHSAITVPTVWKKAREANLETRIGWQTWKRTCT